VVNSTRLATTDLEGWCDGKEVTVELNEVGAVIDVHPADIGGAKH
jgi:hypothetical protein